jgi:hypothetical protein
MNTLIKALLFGAGGYLLWRTGILTAVSGGIIPSPVAGAAPPPAGGAPSAPTGPPAFNSLLVTGQRVQSAALLDYQGGDRSNQLQILSGQPATTWNAWNFFLAKQTNFSDLPDYTTVTGQPDPNVPMTFPQYWQLISPWLTKNHGMTGAPLYGMGWSGQAGWFGRRAGLSGFVNSFPDRQTPRNLFYPNVRVWSF